mmetsp:Transcript_104545/g.186024  ORF Transcript_104545/g.186024 Transcript_104545/m.186024 type:complete len:209 (-) Transcript_104545:1945-2571(-)
MELKKCKAQCRGPGLCRDTSLTELRDVKGCRQGICERPGAVEGLEEQKRLERICFAWHGRLAGMDSWGCMDSCAWWRSWDSLLHTRRCRRWAIARHHLHELCVIHVPIAVHICFSHHLIHFFVCDLLSQVAHNMANLGNADRAASISVKHFEGFYELLLRICILHLPSHEGQEFGEVKRAIAVGIHFVDHVLEFSLRWILPQGAHQRS